MPDLSEDALRAIASISPKAEALLGSISHALLTIPPSSLGYPSERAASSNYYQSSGSVAITPDEVAMVSRVMQVNGISPENTRVRKTLRDNGEAMFHVLQASVARDDSPRDLGGNMFLERGDHSEQLAKICWHLAKAKEYTSNVKQVSVLSHYIESFESGSLFAFEESQKVWVTDVAARVENSIGTYYRTKPLKLERRYHKRSRKNMSANELHGKRLHRAISRPGGRPGRVGWARRDCGLGRGGPAQEACRQLDYSYPKASVGGRGSQRWQGAL